MYVTNASDRLKKVMRIALVNTPSTQASTSTSIACSMNANDVANLFAALIEQAKKDGANELAKQLMDEAKRLS